jgi:tRNA U34 2-thiouridine synthase MnmA/TrmU
MTKKRKAVSLMSGGLDSTLATRLILDQGIEVHGLYLNSPFGCNEEVAKVAAHLGVPLQVVEKGMDYVDLVRNPKYGYGRNMNPCIDCRIYMFIAARKVMDEVGADFIVTGEVVGQRPMSQRRDALHVIDRDSEMDDLVLRPLSAKHLPPTLPEREGWVDREKLLDVVGRSRTVQLALADALALKEYASPAGGCLLTDSHFSERLSTFFEQNADPSLTEVRLLRYGRHVDLGDGAYLILGRNKEENSALRDVSSPEVEAGKMAFFQPLFHGPAAVLWGRVDRGLYDVVGQQIAQLSKKGAEAERRVEVRCGTEVDEIILRPTLLPMAAIL